MSIVITSVGPQRIHVLKIVRELSSLGLAEVTSMLDRPPATFSIREANAVPADVVRRLQDLGCRCSLGTEMARLPADPAFAGHEGTWGFRIESTAGGWGAAPNAIGAIKLIREIADLGLADAKSALEQRALTPIVSRASHEEIRRRFAELGYGVSFWPSGG